MTPSNSWRRESCKVSLRSLSYALWFMVFVLCVACAVRCMCGVVWCGAVGCGAVLCCAVCHVMLLVAFPQIGSLTPPVVCSVQLCKVQPVDKSFLANLTTCSNRGRHLSPDDLPPMASDINNTQSTRPSLDL